MKLIDILVEELPKRGGWRHDVKTMTQDKWKDIWGYNCCQPRLKSSGWWVSKSGADLVNNSKIEVTELAIDWQTAIITREQYESALAAKNDGWIEWGGGECPVEKGTLVDLRYRNSEKFPDTFGTIALAVGGYGATGRHWNHDGYPNDIIAYRLHQPQEADQAKADDEADLNECIGQDAAPVWNGEGLPPVGVECEYSWAGEPWASGVIRYISKHTIIIETQADSTGDTECAYHPTDIKLRPFRTEADRKRDEAVQALCNAGGGIGRVDEESGYGSCWFDIYDAIAAGKIPGVKLDN